MVPEYILIAEDDAAFRRLLTVELADAGFHTRTAVDGIEALEHCERQLPQLLITDLDMPPLGGIELVAELDARTLLTFPVIVLSGRQDLLVQALSFASHIAAKPVDFGRLLPQVRLLMSGRPPTTTATLTPPCAAA